MNMSGSVEDADPITLLLAAGAGGAGAQQHGGRILPVLLGLSVHVSESGPRDHGRKNTGESAEFQPVGGCSQVVT